jgi:hypothetical protein
MPSSFDQNAQDVGLSLDQIEEEIEEGLRLHADRLVAAYDNEEYLACRNAAYVPRRESEEWRDYMRRPKRTSKLVRKAIFTLGKNLYSPGPTRRLKNGAAQDAFLQDVYEKNHINAVMKQADRKATLNGYCAIQAHATGRPEKPIQLYLWSAHELVCWTWPDDPTEVWAVVTITRERRARGMIFEQRVRYDAWTRDEHRVYLSGWKPVPYPWDYCTLGYRGLFGVPSQIQMDISGEPAGSGKNPYGILPFSFAHNETVVSDFYEGGVGTPLRECNAEIDRELSDLAQHAREFMDPDRFLRGVSASWRREKRAGQWQVLTPGKNAEGDAAKDPEALIVQADLAIEAVWFNAQAYTNNTFEDLDVPLVAVRIDASTDLSGIAIVGKHMPLIERARERQPVFAIAEKDLAAMVLHVAGAAYNEPALTAASVDVDMELLWPAPRFPLPTPERDLEDKWEMDEGAKSLIDVVAEREGCTHEEAWEVIVRVQEDNAKLATILQPPAMQQVQQQVQADQMQLEAQANTDKGADNPVGDEDQQ